MRIKIVTKNGVVDISISNVAKNQYCLETLESMK